MVDFTTFDSEGFGDRIRDTRETFYVQNSGVKWTVNSDQIRRLKAMKAVGLLREHSRENGRSNEENSFLADIERYLWSIWTAKL